MNNFALRGQATIEISTRSGAFGPSVAGTGVVAAACEADGGAVSATGLSWRSTFFRRKNTRPAATPRAPIHTAGPPRRGAGAASCRVTAVLVGPVRERVAS